MANKKFDFWQADTFEDEPPFMASIEDNDDIVVCELTRDEAKKLYDYLKIFFAE